MAVTVSILGLIAAGIIFTWIWAPTSDFDNEIKDALAYDKNQAKLDRALKGGHSK